eukprot:4127730-Amphidinium_carterae.2
MCDPGHMLAHVFPGAKLWQCCSLAHAAIANTHNNYFKEFNTCNGNKKEQVRQTFSVLSPPPPKSNYGMWGEGPDKGVKPVGTSLSISDEHRDINTSWEHSN